MKSKHRKIKSAYLKPGIILRKFCFKINKYRCHVCIEMKNVFIGNSLVTQWLGLHIYTAGTEGSVLAQGTKMLQAVLGGQKKSPYCCL